MFHFNWLRTKSFEVVVIFTFCKKWVLHKMIVFLGSGSTKNSPCSEVREISIFIKTLHIWQGNVCCFRTGNHPQQTHEWTEKTDYTITIMDIFCFLCSANTYSHCCGNHTMIPNGNVRYFSISISLISVILKTLLFWLLL